MKEEKRLRHWLHIILALLTGGLWLAVYGILIAVNEMNNRVVRGYNQGYREAHVSVGQRETVYTWWGTPHNPRGSVGAQAVLTQNEGDDYRSLLSMIVTGDPMTDEQQQRFLDLRSRFK